MSVTLDEFAAQVDAIYARHTSALVTRAEEFGKEIDQLCARLECFSDNTQKVAQHILAIREKQMARKFSESPLAPKVLGNLAGPIEHSFREYAGLSYQAASIEASKLIAAANASGDWTIYLPERLIALREVMRRHMVSIVKDAS
ncbi:hypothetical protein [Neorhizobium sp. LjRoot104]|uniref:hypothetical protein n=1 Tax=Neorhizobium sp. LjRoot104 TaxID=3342254 RepID=UPI003ECF77FE